MGWDALQSFSKQVALLVALGLVGTVNGALPLLGGPGVAPDAPNAYTMPRMEPGRKLTNNGIALAMVTGAQRSYPIRWGIGLQQSVLKAPSNTPANVDVQAFAMNRAGVVAGATIVTESPYNSVALRWNVDASIPTTLFALDVPTISSIPRFAQDMNQSGRIVGGSATPASSLSLSPVQWLSNTQNAAALVGLPGSPYTVATHISDDTRMAGFTTSSTLDNPIPDMRPVRWADGPSHAPEELQSLSYDINGYSQATITQLSASEVAVGFAQLYASDGTNFGRRAVRWDRNTTNIKALESSSVTSSSGNWISEATDVNFLGDAVGNSINTTTGVQRAMRWPYLLTNGYVLLRNTNNTDTTDSRANAISRLGTIAGYANVLNGTEHRAAIWPKKSNIAIDLNSKIAPGSWILQEATHVSETGYVAGSGMYDPDGSGPETAYQRLFLILVPEAGTYGMGDANFDLSMNFLDMLIVSQNYNHPNPNLSYNVGDFNLNGITDFNDLVALAQSYLYQLPSLQANEFSEEFLSDWALARATVPEPSTAIGTLSIALMLQSRRRTRTRTPNPQHP